MRPTEGRAAEQEISVTRLESDMTGDVMRRELLRARVRTHIDDPRVRMARYTIGRRARW